MFLFPTTSTMAYLGSFLFIQMTAFSIIFFKMTLIKDISTFRNYISKSFFIMILLK